MCLLRVIMCCYCYQIIKRTYIKNTVGFHNFNLRIFNSRVSNPNNLIVDVFFDTMSDFNVPGSRPKQTRINFGNRPYCYMIEEELYCQTHYIMIRLYTSRRTYIDSSCVTMRIIVSSSSRRSSIISCSSSSSCIIISSSSSIIINMSICMIVLACIHSLGMT